MYRSFLFNKLLKKQLQLNKILKIPLQGIKDSFIRLNYRVLNPYIFLIPS